MADRMSDAGRREEAEQRRRWNADYIMENIRRRMFRDYCIYFGLDGYGPPLCLVQEVGVLERKADDDELDLFPGVPLNLNLEKSDGESRRKSPYGAQSLGVELTMSAYDDQDQYEAKGFAKLDFPDGAYIITTPSLLIGRNMDLADKWRRQKKQKRHQKRAREALEQYELEPSQPSQADNGVPNGHPSSGSGSLEGRPEPGLPSNFSEQGGAVHYQDMSDDDQMPRSRKRRRLLKSNSSNTSATPASVHPSQIDLSGVTVQPGDDQDQPASARLPVHPANPDDILKISQEHLIIRYNQSISQWELDCIGNRAIVDGEHLDRNSKPVLLYHNSEIRMPGVFMTFKLPDNSHPSPTMTPGTFSEVPESDILSIHDSESEASPSRIRSGAIKAGDSEDDSEDEDESDGQGLSRKRSGVNLKFKKSAGRNQKIGDLAESPDDSERATKGGKSIQTKESPDEQGRRELAESSAVAPSAAEPGSGLVDIPQDQLPLKRKGPGRPPKNGVVSKKDEKSARKIIREFESRGEIAPSYSEAVQQVRRENKLKDQQKLNGGGPSSEMDSIMPSIETSGSAQQLTGTTTGPSASPKLDSVPGQPSAERVKKSSPRTNRSPELRAISPVKPESECTEEELKKPGVTYVPLIDEAIRHSRNGEYADLQEIYKIIQKLHPYFAYRVEGNGWQSSVRHNLKHNRFEQRGKSGKGGFHGINYNVPLPNSEQKKGRRATPPPRPPMPLPNGQYAPQPQYGHPNYQYSQVPGSAYPNPQMPQMQGNQTYQSPYGQTGSQAPMQPPPTNYAQNTPPQAHRPPANGAGGIAPAPAQQRPPPQPPQTAQQFGGLVPAIMDWRVKYLQPFLNREQGLYEIRETMFKGVLERLSALFQLSPANYASKRNSLANELKTEEEVKILLGIGPLFDFYHKAEHGRGSQPAQASNASQQNSANAPAPAPPSQVQNAVGAAVAQADATASADANVNANTPGVVQPAPASNTPLQPPVPSPVTQPPPSNPPPSAAPSNPSVSAPAAGQPASNQPSDGSLPTATPLGGQPKEASAPPPTASEQPRPTMDPGQMLSPPGTAQVPTQLPSTPTPAAAPPAPSANTPVPMPSTAPPPSQPTTPAVLTDTPAGTVAGVKRSASEQPSPETFDEQLAKRLRAGE